MLEWIYHMRITHKATSSWRRPTTQPLNQGTDRWKECIPECFLGPWFHWSWKRSFGCRSQVVAISQHKPGGLGHHIRLQGWRDNQGGLSCRDLDQWFKGGRVLRIITKGRCVGITNKKLVSRGLPIMMTHPTQFPDHNPVIDSTPLERSGGSVLLRKDPTGTSQVHWELPFSFPQRVWRCLRLPWNKEREYSITGHWLWTNILCFLWSFFFFGCALRHVGS